MSEPSATDESEDVVFADDAPLTDEEMIDLLGPEGFARYQQQLEEYDKWLESQLKVAPDSSDD